jgi:hypothetical protein
MTKFPDIRLSQLQILKHTVGLNRRDADKILRRYHRKTKYREPWEEAHRNYFASSGEGRDYEIIQELCELGLMEYHYTQFDLEYYIVTTLGKQLCGIQEEV